MSVADENRTLARKGCEDKKGRGKKKRNYDKKKA